MLVQKVAVTTRHPYGHEKFSIGVLSSYAFKNEIGYANAIYIGGMCFIMAHEFSHNFLGHTHYPENQEVTIEDEMNADESALSFIATVFSGEFGLTYKVGIANVLCALLLIGQDTISSDGAHPHMDVRIANIMNKLMITSTISQTSLYNKKISNFIFRIFFLLNTMLLVMGC